MYLYETHCHSSDCSRCGRSTARELVRAYHTAGFAGLVLTDHFVTGNSAVDRSLPWEAQMRRYYDAYLEACEEATGLDFDVLFGIEHAYGDGKEVLVYGIDLKFLLENPDLDRISLDAFVERVHAAGGVVVHAHPYRQRVYIDLSVPPRLDVVDGIEVYNAGNLPKDGDLAALAHSRERAYLLTCGSDLHEARSSKLGQAGVLLSRRVRSGSELVEALKKNVAGYLVKGLIVPEIRAEHLMDEF